MARSYPASSILLNLLFNVQCSDCVLTENRTRIESFEFWVADMISCNLVEKYEFLFRILKFGLVWMNEVEKDANVMIYLNLSLIF